MDNRLALKHQVCCVWEYASLIWDCQWFGTVGHVHGLQVDVSYPRATL